MSTQVKIAQKSTEKTPQGSAQKKPGCLSRFCAWTKKTWKDKIQVRIDRDVKALEKKSEVID